MKAIKHFITLLVTLSLVSTSGLCDGPLTYSFGGFPGINSLAIDHDGIIWVVSQGKLFKYDGTTWTENEKIQEYAVYSMNMVHSVKVDSHNNIWVTTPEEWGTPLWKFDGNEWSSLSWWHEEDLLDSFRGIDILGFTSGGIWVAVWFEFENEECWVEYYDGSAWKTYTTADGLVSNNVRSMAVDKNGSAWFGTDSGVSKFDGESWTAFTTDNGLINNFIRTIFVDSNEDLWFGTSNGGISHYDGSSWTNYVVYHYYYCDADYYDPPIRCCAEDNMGNLWFGHSSGIAKYDGTEVIEGRKLYSNFNFPEVNVLDIVVDNNNIKWLRTEPSGIVLFDDSVLSVELDQQPEIINLLPNSPNPFNPSTTITFSLPSNGFTSLIIYNLMGQKIRNLLMETKQAGTHSIIWDGKDEKGIPISSGIYFSKLLQGNHSSTGKMMLVR